MKLKFVLLLQCAFGRGKLLCKFYLKCNVSLHNFKKSSCGRFNNLFPRNRTPAVCASHIKAHSEALFDINVNI